MSLDRVLVILGTARDDSNTLKSLKSNLPFAHFELIELHNLEINCDRLRFEVIDKSKNNKLLNRRA
jgi:hypothetical protein